MKILILIVFFQFFRCSLNDFDKSFDQRPYIISKYNFSYPISELLKINSFKDNTLIIHTCEDLRDDKNVSYFPLIAFPFVPYASSYYSKPEQIKINYLNYQPEMDIPNSLKDFLTDLSIFKNIKYTDNFNDNNSDFILNCKIIKNSQKSRNTIYGLSIFPRIFIKSVPTIVVLYLHTNYPLISTELEIRITETKTKKQIYGKNFSYENWYANLELFPEFTERKFFVHQKKILDYISYDLIKFWGEFKK